MYLKLPKSTYLKNAVMEKICKAGIENKIEY